MARKYLLVGIIVAVLALIVAGVGLHQAYRFWFSSAADDATEVSYTVKEGDRIGLAAYELEELGLVNSFWFRVYARLADANMQPGTYSLKEGMSYAEIFGLLKWGNRQEVTLTVPEGFTIEQISERVVELFPGVNSNTWQSAVGSESSLETHAFIVVSGKPDDVDLEGYLFPDTYSFFADATADEIVKMLIDTMQERVETAGLMNKVGEGEEFATLHEALTLASIIEKEVRQPETMKNIADIFLKRLEIGMALQSDATVNYITGGDDPSVSYADLEIDSQYNTYKYPGLPPGPISNPGLNALTAVANPTRNDYFYFLTTDEGEVYYAVTHDEHVSNKAQYLR